MSKIYFPISKTCSAAYAVEAAGIRKKAYPFDWLGQSFKTISYILDNGIDHLLDDYEIIYSDDYRDTTPDKTMLPIIWDKTYNMLFIHEGVDTSIDEIKQKFTRRYNRLVSDLKNSEIVVLIYATTCETPLWEHWNRWEKHFKSKIPNKSVDDGDIECVKESILKINPDIKIEVIKSAIWADVVEEIKSNI